LRGIFLEVFDVSGRSVVYVCSWHDGTPLLESARCVGVNRFRLSRGIAAIRFPYVSRKLADYLMSLAIKHKQQNANMLNEKTFFTGVVVYAI
jgi:hypothetical protein